MADKKRIGLDNLSPVPGSRGKRKRVGRGPSSGHGKTSGRGHKGQKSRSGASIPAWFEGGQMPLQRRLPKVGFRSRVGLVTAEVRLHELNKVEGDVADIAALKAANVLSQNVKYAKVMLSGELKKALTVRGLRLTKGARAAVEAAGGKVED
mgnify:CR=1 FL=1